MSHGSWNALVAKSLPDATGPGPLSVTVIWADARVAVHTRARVHSINNRFMVPRSRSRPGLQVGRVGPSKRIELPRRLRETVDRPKRQSGQEAPSVVLGRFSIADG